MRLFRKPLHMNTLLWRSKYAAIGLLVYSALSLFSVKAQASFGIYDTSYSWVEDNGKPVQLKEWKGKKTFITMAYSECRKVCTVTLKKLNEIQAVADKKHQSIEIVVVSIDPATDTPATWSAYRKKHDLVQRSNWHFLSGSARDTQYLANHLGIQFWAIEDHVMHDFKIAALNPEGAIEKFIDWDHRDINIFF
jgi:protein SCO1